MKIVDAFFARQRKLLRKIVIISITLFFVLSLQGCYFFPQEEEVLAPPLKVPEEIVYRTVKVQKGTIEKRINSTAYFVSDLQTDVSFKHRGGRIESIHVKTGDVVKEGDLLIQLENDSLETQLLQQETSLTKLKLNYNQTLSSMERSIELAQLQLDESKKKLKELKDTIANISGGLSVKDISPGLLEQAEALEEQVKRQEITLEGEIEKYNNTKILMELDIKNAEMQKQSIETELEKTRIVAPVPGQVVWITQVKEGDYVNAHTTLVRIADLHRLKLRYTGDNLSDFKIGAEVEVKIDNKDYVGVVVMNPSTAPFDADESIRRSVLIDVKDLPQGIPLGCSARISLLLEKKEDVIVISRNLLHGFMGQYTVQVLEDGIKTDRSVQIGVETPTEVEIVNGLEEGEELIEW